VALLILLVIGTVSYQSMAELVESAWRLTATHEALDRLSELCSQLERATDIEAYYPIIQKLDRQLGELRSLAAQDPARQPEIEALARLVASEAAAVQEWARQPKAEKAAGTIRMLSSRGQRELTEEIREAISGAKRRQPERAQRWRADAVGRVRHTVLVIASGISLSFLLMVVLGLFVIRGISKSVGKLVAATEQIAGGRLEGSIPVTTKDELGRLAASLGGMAQRLEQAQGALQDQVQTLQSILDNLRNGVVVADANGETLLVNPAALQLLGVTATDGRLEKGWERNTLYWPDGTTPYPADRLPLAAALRGEAVDWTEVFVRPPDLPQGRWLSVAARPLTNADGSLRGGVVVLNDVTAHRRAEAALRDSERLLKAILETLPVGVWVADPEGNITMANPASHEIWGGLKHIGTDQYEAYRAWWEKTHERMQAQRWPLARAVATGEGALAEPVEIEAFDGTRKTVAQSAVPLRDPNRHLIGFVAVSQDISQAQQREKQIRELVEELRQRALDLEAVNKELEAFSWSVSHDLRAPLRSIEGFSRALLEDHAAQLRDEAQDDLRRVVAGALRMGQLIDDLLRLSRVTRSEIHPVTVDLSALAQSIAAELSKSQPEREVEFVIAPGLVVNADAQLLRIVMENLLGNAWKFTSKQATAKIEVGRALWQGQAMFFVRDNGAGFDMAYRDQLFRAFQRLHPTTEFEGTGIGLATVQRVIHRHGGRVAADGAVGQGATFYFTLP